MRADRDTRDGQNAITMTVGCLATLDAGQVPTWQRFRSRPTDPTPIYDSVAADLFTAETRHPLRWVPPTVQRIIPARPLSYRATARRGDPDTSHQAARTVRTDSRAHERILQLLGGWRFGLTDEQLLIRWEDVYGDDAISPSGLRTRRKELSDAGLIVDSGERGRTASGRACIVWRLA